MKLKVFFIGLLISLFFCNSIIAQSMDFSNDRGSKATSKINLGRTKILTKAIKKYLSDNDAYVALISRRGAGDPSTGTSDTDPFDLSGMAHTGFAIRQGFSRNADYVTFNLVREKSAKVNNGVKYDLSELRVWSLDHFFLGAFEKDAIVFLPKKDVQLKLWNLLRANGAIKIEKRKEKLKDKMGKFLYDASGEVLTRVHNVIKNGVFALLHNHEYNLLSDYAESSTQNCNEHLLKVYIAIRDYGDDVSEILAEKDLRERDYLLTKLKRKLSTKLEDNFNPTQIVLSRTQSSFTGVQNLRLGERYAKVSRLFLGFKWKGEKFDIVGVESFCSPENREFLAWEDYKVFREDYNERLKKWYVEDWGKRYVKVNRFTGKENK